MRLDCTHMHARTHTHTHDHVTSCGVPGNYPGSIAMHSEFCQVRVQKCMDCELNGMHTEVSRFLPATGVEWVCIVIHTNFTFSSYFWMS